MLEQFVRIFIALVFLSSCAVSEKNQDRDEALLINENYSLKAKEALSEKAVSEDIQTLLYALKNGYGGRKYVPQKEFIEAISGLEKITLKNPSSQVFCVEIESHLLKIPDMHLAAKLEESKCSAARRNTFKKGDVGPNFSRKTNKAWELNSVKVGRQRVPVLSITSFPSSEDATWNGFIDTVGKLKVSAPAVIIDLRGNGGGDDSKGLTMAGYFFGQTAPTSVQEIVKSQTPPTYAFMANRVLKMRAKKEFVPPYLLQKYEQNMKSFREAKEGKLEPERIVPGDGGPDYDAKKAYKKPIVVLVDRGCASSCESTLEALLLHPHVVTVGENSAGYLHFGNIGYVVLPNSQIEIQLATDFWKYKDGRYLEGIGYEPKIKVPPGEDALDAAKKFLKKTIPN